MLDVEYKSYRTLDYAKIGLRLRSQRKKNNLSQEELLGYLQENGLPRIGRNNLSRIENGEPKAFESVSLAVWDAICARLGCSIGYLLGEYDCKDYDLQFVKDKTGLLEEAIKKLFDMHGEYGDVISTIIDDDNFEYLMVLFKKRFQYSSIDDAVKPIVRTDENGRHYLVNAPEFHKHFNDTHITIPFDESRFFAQKKNLLDSLISTAITDRMFEMAKRYAGINDDT